MITKQFLYFSIHLTILYCRLSTANPLVGKNVKPANENEFPFFVALSSSSDITEKEDYFCGGTLISKRHVLTAEHCLEDGGHNITLIINATNLQYGTAYKVKSWIVYKDWAAEHNIIPGGYSNDIAIITLSQEVKDVEPAIISELKHYEVIGKTVITAGWGFVNETMELTPDTLMKTFFKVLNPTEYRTKIFALFGIKSRYDPSFYFTSAELPAVLSCGDSGGPLMLASNKRLVGINSSVCDVDNPENNQHVMNRHASIDYYRAFIEDVIKD